MPTSLAINSGLANKDRSFHEAPEKTGGEGWLYSEQPPFNPCNSRSSMNAHSYIQTFVVYLHCFWHCDEVEGEGIKAVLMRPRR